ncbi:hypothetical protein NIT62_09200 [Mammaliicoccus sciuri]|nr:hypothetical protein NIT62_09200 [Mammaliicoccus sciuri]
MVRSIIKQVYLSVIFVFNKLFKSNVKSKNVVVFMTFKEDVLPIIEALKKEQYHITVIAHPKWIDFLNDIDVDKVINLSNKYVLQQLKAIKSSKIIIIDTYYLLLGSISKTPEQKVIQTFFPPRHAAGALKNLA